MAGTKRNGWGLTFGIRRFVIAGSTRNQVSDRRSGSTQVALAWALNNRSRE